MIIQRAFAATFVISSDVFEDKRVDPVDFRIIAFKHYYISYNNEPRKFLSAGEYSSLAENESLEFVVNDNQRIPLDTRLSERILTILRTGHQCITYTPGIQVPRLAGSAPPSAYVMYYLKYGFADYSEGLKPKVNYEFIGRQLQPTLSVLQSGDIIVIQRNNSLEFTYTDNNRTDIKLDPLVLQSIFFKNSPLHDGAVVIKNNRIIATRVVLPLSDKAKLPAKYGLRHRAGLGITEKTDALVLVISEQTGKVVYVKDSEFYPMDSFAALKETLSQDLSE